MYSLSRVCLPVVLLLSTSAFAYAEDAAAPEPATAAQSMSSAPAPADDPNEVVCRKGQPVTGSLFPGPRMCHTRREWADMQQQSHDVLMRQQTTSGAGNAPGK